MVHTPEWVKNAVFYQIFPDRFARSPRMKHPPGLTFKPWGSPPEDQGFQGGDLYGVVDKLEYLRTLGVTALYLNPIFASASNHRYHTFDYLRVDPLLGGDDALRELLDAAHAHGMYVVLDGVFNHASRGFWPFHHVLENGPDSPYADWFVIHDWPLRPYPESEKEALNYAAWWNLPALPKLNTDNPGVRELILETARYWLEFGIDGWRLDVPAEIDDDDFWRAFRTVVKTANPEAYICGEVWEEASRWLQGDQFDAVMNYQLTEAILSFCGADTLRPGYVRGPLTFEPLDARGFSRAVGRVMEAYPWEVTLAQMNLLDSHDTARALWILGEDEAAFRLSVLLLMTLPGAPCIYYGDEIGLSAGDDPASREAYPWDEPGRWNEGLLTFFQRVAALRHEYGVLRTGSYEPVHASGRTFAFLRRLDGWAAVVLVNAGRTPTTMTVELPASRTAWRRAWPKPTTEPETVEGPEATTGRLSVALPAMGGAVYVAA